MKHPFHYLDKKKKHLKRKEYEKEDEIKKKKINETKPWEQNWETKWTTERTKKKKKISTSTKW